MDFWIWICYYLKNKKDAAQNLEGRVIYCLLIRWNTKMRKQNLSMAWIDHEKTYDMVPHWWIIDLFGNSRNKWKDLKTLAESMKSWQFELTSGEENLGEVNLRPGIFQGKSLSSLLFVVCLLPVTVILWRCCTKIPFCKQRTKS